MPWIRTLILGFLVVPLVLSAQVAQQPITVQNAPPSGACSYPVPSIMVTVAPNQGWWQCINGNWEHTAPSSGSGFPITIGSTTITADATVAALNGVDIGTTTPGAGNFTTLTATQSIASGGPAPTACGTATGCVALSEGSTQGVPTAGQAYIRADAATNSWLASINGTAEAALTLPVYTNGGTRLANAHIVTGSVTLTSGAASVTLTGAAQFSSSTSYTCTVSDATNASAGVAPTSGTAFNVTGTGTDTVGYICVGN